MHVQDTWQEPTAMCLPHGTTQGRHASRRQTLFFDLSAWTWTCWDGQLGKACGPVGVPAHLIHGGVEGEELGVPVGASCLLILPLELLGAEVPQQVFQTGVRLQAAQVKVGRSEGRPRSLLGESRDVSRSHLSEDDKMTSCGLHSSPLDTVTEILGCFLWGKFLYLIVFPKMNKMYLKICIAGIHCFRFKCLFLKRLVKIFPGSFVFQTASIWIPLVPFTEKPKQVRTAQGGVKGK